MQNVQVNVYGMLGTAAVVTSCADKECGARELGSVCSAYDVECNVVWGRQTEVRFVT